MPPNYLIYISTFSVDANSYKHVKPRIQFLKEWQQNNLTMNIDQPDWFHVGGYHVGTGHVWFQGYDTVSLSVMGD